jgi:uncharacterized membrane protein YeaQ/YmgE (transglycosylase-associated protein family)
VTSPISAEPQPEPRPPATVAASPSLWLYFVLLVTAAALTWLAFAIQGRTDWPGLLVNLAAGLVGSVVILVVIDRRLRASELEVLRRFPTRTTRGLAWLVFPTKRTGSRYVQRLLVALEPLVSTKVERARFEQLEDKVRAGFVLLSGAGEGKTTWTQFAARSLGRKYLDGDPEGRIPILFPMASWLPDRTLHEALLETFASFAKCPRKRFDRILASGDVVVLLDGYDELWKKRVPFWGEVKRLRSQFPKVALTVTSRSDKPTPTDFGEVISLGSPSADELDAIRRRNRR